MGLVASALAAVFVVAIVMLIIFQGGTKQQIQSPSTGASGYDFGGQISGALSMLRDAFRFMSAGGLAQVQTTAVGLIADTFTGNELLAPTCGNEPKNSFIALTNTGTANGTATGVTITYRGAHNAFAIAGSCTVGPSGSSTATMYVLFRGPNKLANSAVPLAGEPYAGTVILSNGVQLPFTGRFSQGYPQISTTGLALPASDFREGKPMNPTCSTTPNSANAYLTLTNTGTVSASVTLVTITWKGATNTFSISGPCSVGPEGTSSAITYILFGATNNLSAAAETGHSFTGTVTLSTGAQIPFSGAFQ